MPSNQLDLIRHYCDTAGIRLSSAEKDLLCLVLENPSRYDGFTSQEYSREDSGKDFRGRWDSIDRWQYRINIGSTLTIDKRYMHACDGYVQDEHWDWSTAWTITDTRTIIKALQEMESEL